jgi:hypothetical protein
VRPSRAQLSWDLVDQEDWLAADHPARLVCAFVETLDLTRLYDAVLAREALAPAGRTTPLPLPAPSPKQNAGGCISRPASHFSLAPAA